MFTSKTEPKIIVPVSEGTVFTVQGPAAQEKSVRFENLDVANTLTWRFQFSDDGTTWTDVAVNATLPPGGQTRVSLTAHVFHRLRALGNLNIAVQVDTHIAFAGVFSSLNV